MRLQIALALAVSAPLPAQEVVLRANNGPTPLALGTTQGISGNRVVIRGATVLSGRSAPGSNRAMPPEGPVDIIIENDASSTSS